MEAKLEAHTSRAPTPAGQVSGRKALQLRREARRKRAELTESDGVTVGCRSRVKLVSQPGS